MVADRFGKIEFDLYLIIVVNSIVTEMDEREMQSRLRILICMPEAGSVGGVLACEPPFVAALRAQEGAPSVEETIYTHNDRRCAATPIQRASRVVRTALRLRRQTHAQRYDIIHLNTSFDFKALLRDFTTLLFLWSQAGAIFLKMHGSEANFLKTKNPLLRLMIKTLLGRVGAIGVLSSEEKGNFMRAGVDAGKIHVVKNAVAEKRFAHDERPAAAEQTPRLLFIARFIPSKGLSDVIEACHLVKARGHDFRLLCVGDGPQRVSAEAQVARCDLQTIVSFTGYVPEAETYDFYARSTMLLFPTYHDEGFPMVVFNALAAGLPIITTRIRAAADYLREPENCLWVEAKNPAALAEHIIHLLHRADLRTQMSDANRTLARRFAPDIVAAEYLTIYKHTRSANKQFEI